MLIIPKIHFASFFDASADEISAIDDLIKQAKDVYEQALKFQKDGDWANYGAQLNVLEKIFEELIALTNEG